MHWWRLTCWKIKIIEILCIDHVWANHSKYGHSGGRWLSHDHLPQTFSGIAVVKVGCRSWRGLKVTNLLRRTKTLCLYCSWKRKTVIENCFGSLPLDLVLRLVAMQGFSNSGITRRGLIIFLCFNWKSSFPRVMVVCLKHFHKQNTRLHKLLSSFISCFGLNFKAYNFRFAGQWFVCVTFQNNFSNAWLLIQLAISSVRSPCKLC